jgi:TonB-linked SusC/RagA family outer membrane protein
MSNLILKGKKFSKLLLSCILLLGSVITAQSQVVSGIVKSGSDNQPLRGVTVQIKGTSNSTATDSKGHYLLKNVSSSDSLFFSYVGFGSETVSVDGRTSVNVNLQAEASSLQEVVIGYGTQKKSDLTGSISRVDAKAFEDQSMTQLTDMLTGTVAGVNINQGSSASGASAALEIRGRTSLNASNAPMIVVDGSIFNGGIEEINPTDVKTIDILKDASSAAIYGARASNGVILITTKTGGRGKPTINFSTQIGTTETTHSVTPYNAQQYIQYRTDLLKGWGTGFPNYYFDDPNNLPAGVTLDKWRNASSNPQNNNKTEWLNRLRFFPTEQANYLTGKTTDWYKLVMPRGLKQTYNLSVSGGSNNFKYYWSGGYVNNEGIIKGDTYAAVRTRLNLDFKIADWITIGINSQFSNQDYGVSPAPLDQMYSVSPYGSEYDSTGGMKWYPNDYQDEPNPLLNTYNQKISHKASSLFATLYADLKLPFGIEYKLSYQPHYRFGHNYNFWPSATTIMGGSTHRNGYGSREESRQNEWTLDNIVHWRKHLGVQDLDLTLLYSTEEHQNWYSLLTNENFAPNENLGFNALQFGISPSITNNDTKETGDAIMARANYTLLNRYLLTLSVRRDGYSAFGQKNPRANFPAAAFAWKISDEKFFKIDWIDQMKLRLSWGVNGNRDIGPYAALAQISPNLYYDGANTVVGIYNSSLANPSLAWEKTEATNIGLDLGVLANKVVFNLNYYNMKTTNLLMNRILPAITGFNNITSNLGEVDNQGFEFTVNSNNITKSKFSWNTNFVLSLNRNKIKHLFGDYQDVTVGGKTVKQEVPDYTNQWFPGHAIDAVWDYNVTGIWQESERAAAAGYHMVPGDFKSQDVNGDGTYQALADKKFIGYREPRYRLGLRNEFTFFNNLSLTIFIRADLGQIKAFPSALHIETSEYDRKSMEPVPYWTPSHPINDYPRLLVNTTGYGGGLMVYRSSSFVRIQDLVLSYIVPEQIAKRASLNNVRIYGSARNLYSFTKWPGWDAESGNLPMNRTYTLGFSFSL